MEGGTLLKKRKKSLPTSANFNITRWEEPSWLSIENVETINNEVGGRTLKY